MMVCPACGDSVASSARFCSGCGEVLVAPRGGALQRILTIAFVDLVGSTAFAAENDLEHYDRMLLRYHDICAETVTSFGGRVLELQGDGVLACFGLAEDGENAAVAAIAAMLAILEAVPRAIPAVGARAGIHSGTVMSHVSTTEQVPRMTGLNVNIAARVQAEAKPGGLVLTDATMDLARRIASLDAENLGPVRVKGVADAIGIHVVAGFASGREQAEPVELFERGALLDQMAADSGGSGPAAFAVFGGPGIGKSVILAELIRRSAPGTRGVHLSARLNLRHTPLFPVAVWLAAALGYSRFPLDPATPQADMAARLAAVHPGLSADGMAVLADLLGVADSSGLGGRYTTAQLREMRIAQITQSLAQLMAREPVLLTFDDMHWADADSLEVIDRLLRGGLPATTRLVVTARPDAGAAVFAERHRLTMLQPQPLTESGARGLLAGNRAISLSDDESDRIVALAEGNPLFLRTLLALYRRNGGIAGNGSLPPSIEATFQGVVGSFGAARDVLLVAAVVGRVFAAEELAWLMPDQARHLPARLDEFARNGVIEPDDGGWRFSHILMQEAAYQMIPGSRRRSLHRAAAVAIAANDPIRAAAFPEVVADHAIASGDAVLVASACNAAGIGCLRRAVFDRAIHYLETGAAALAGDDAAMVDTGQQRLELLRLLASAKVQSLGFSHRETEDSYHRLEAAAVAACGTTFDRLCALYGLCAHRIISGNVRASSKILHRMQQIADLDDPQQRLIVNTNLGGEALYQGRLDDCLAIHAQVQADYDRERDGRLFLALGSDPLIAALTGSANIAALRGNAENVRTLTSAALAHVEAIGAELQKPWVLIFTGVALGTGNEARAQIDAGIMLADRQGSSYWALTGRILLAVMDNDRGVESGDTPPLVTLLTGYEAMGCGLMLPHHRSVEAVNMLRAGRGEAALALARRACIDSVLTGQGLWLPQIWGRRAVIERALGDSPAAMRSARLALAYARRAGASAVERPLLALFEGLAQAQAGDIRKVGHAG